MDRDELRRLVREQLDDRQLVYFGIRGDDAEGIGDVPELRAVFSVVGAHRGRTGVSSLALEDLTNRRVDLDTHDIDDDLGTPEVVELRRAVLRVLSSPSVVVTYRPSTFLSAICFARREHRCTYAGMFKDHQAAFEHKPWVESAVRGLGIPSIPWVYVADEEQLETLQYLSDGPVMLRRSRSSGGTGLTRVASGAELAATWPQQDESFVSVAPFIPNGIPTNVGGVVWRDGVTLHRPSVQLIGIPGCTSRPFGYCGNDFGAIRDQPPEVIQQMDEATRSIGDWLRSHGFRGAFGVDFLVTEKGPLFTEVNPRLQGVTHLACQLSAAAGQSCIMLEHLAATLDIPAPPDRTLAEQLRDGADLAHLVIHRTEDVAGAADAEGLADAMLEWPEAQRADVTARREIIVDPGATLTRITIDDRVTATGFELLEPWASRVSAAVVGTGGGTA